MTGEFFELLSKKSILNTNIQPVDLHDAKFISSFKQGVKDACKSNLLHAVFKVRTNDLMNKLTKEENFTYLSGLLISAELQEIIRQSSAKIYLCCGSGLKIWYETALETLGIIKNTHIFPSRWVDESVIRGQYKIWNPLSRSNNG
jgi:2-dehydro-3-deoxygalactonokinase